MAPGEIMAFPWEFEMGGMYYYFLLSFSLCLSFSAVSDFAIIAYMSVALGQLSDGIKNGCVEFE